MSLAHYEEHRSGDHVRGRTMTVCAYRPDMAHDGGDGKTDQDQIKV